MASGPGGEIANEQADGGADEADEEALQQEDAADLAGLDAEAHQHGDVAGLLHHHHGERDEDVERGDDDDERDDDEGDNLFELEGAEELAVQLHPVGGHEAASGGLLDFAANLRGAVEIVDFETDYREQVRLAEEPLGIAEAQKGSGGIVLIEARMEDARDAEALVFGREAEGRQFALRAGDEDAIADLRADLLSEVFAEDQRRIGRCRLVAQRGPVGIERIFWRGGWRRLGVENLLPSRK